MMDSVEGVRRDLLSALVNQRKYFKHLVGGDGETTGHLDDSFSGIYLSENQSTSDEQRNTDVWTLQLLLSIRQLFLRKLRAYAVHEKEVTAEDLPKIQTLQADIQRLNNQLSQRQDALRQAYAAMRGAGQPPLTRVQSSQAETEGQRLRHRDHDSKRRPSYTDAVLSPSTPVRRYSSEPPVSRRVTFHGISSPPRVDPVHETSRPSEHESTALDDTGTSGSTDTTVRLLRYGSVPAASHTHVPGSSMGEVVAAFHRASQAVEEKLSYARQAVPGGSPTNKFDTLIRKLCTSPLPAGMERPGPLPSVSSHGHRPAPAPSVPTVLEQAQSSTTAGHADAAVQVSLCEPSEESRHAAPPVVDRVRVLLATIGCDDVLDLSLGGIVTDTHSVLKEAQTRRAAERAVVDAESRVQARSAPVAPVEEEGAVAVEFDLGDDSVHSVLLPGTGPGPGTSAAAVSLHEVSADSHVQNSVREEEEQSVEAEEVQEDGKDMVGYVSVVSLERYDEDEDALEHPSTPAAHRSASPVAAVQHSSTAAPVPFPFAHVAVSGTVAIDEDEQAEGEGAPSSIAEGQPPGAAEGELHMEASEVSVPEHEDEGEGLASVPGLAQRAGEDASMSWALSEDSAAIHHATGHMGAAVAAAHSPVNSTWPIEGEETGAIGTPSRAGPACGVESAWTPYQAVTPHSGHSNGSPDSVLSTLSPIQPLQPHTGGRTGQRRAGLPPASADSEVLDQDTSGDVVESLLFLDEDGVQEAVGSTGTAPTPGSATIVHSDKMCTPAVSAPSSAGGRTGDPGEAIIGSGSTTASLYTDSKPPKYTAALASSSTVQGQGAAMASSNAGGAWHVSPNTSVASVASTDHSLALSVASRAEPAPTTTPTPQADKEQSRDTAKAILVALLQSPCVSVEDSTCVHVPSSAPDADSSVRGIRFAADTASSGGQIHKRLQFDDPATSTSVTASSAVSFAAGSLADMSSTQQEQQMSLPSVTVVPALAPSTSTADAPTVGRKQKKNKLARRLFDDDGTDVGASSLPSGSEIPSGPVGMSTVVLPPVKPPSPLAARVRLARSNSPARLVYQGMEQRASESGAAGQAVVGTSPARIAQQARSRVDGQGSSVPGLESELELASTSSWEYVVPEPRAAGSSTGGQALDTSTARAAAHTSPRAAPSNAVEEWRQTDRLPLLPGICKQETLPLPSPLVQALSSASRLLPSRIPVPVTHGSAESMNGPSVSPRKQTRTMLPLLGLHSSAGPIKALPLPALQRPSLLSPPLMHDPMSEPHGQAHTPGTDPKGTPGSPSSALARIVRTANVPMMQPASPPVALKASPSSSPPQAQARHSHSPSSTSGGNAPSPSPGKPPKAILSPERQAIHAAAAREEALLVQRVAKKVERAKRVAARKAGGKGVMTVVVKRQISSGLTGSETPEDPTAPTGAGSSSSPRPVASRANVRGVAAVATVMQQSDGYSPEAYSPSKGEGGPVEAAKVAHVQDGATARALTFV